MKNPVTLKSTRPARPVRNYGRKHEPSPDELTRLCCRYELESDEGGTEFEKARRLWERGER